MHDGWMSWGNGGFGGMWLGPIIWIVVIGFGIWAVAGLMRRGGADGFEPRLRKTPRDILDERFAKGEIDEEEYQRRRKAIDS